MNNQLMKKLVFVAIIAAPSAAIASQEKTIELLKNVFDVESNYQYISKITPEFVKKAIEKAQTTFTEIDMKNIKAEAIEQHTSLFDYLDGSSNGRTLENRQIGTEIAMRTAVTNLENHLETLND